MVNLSREFAEEATRIGKIILSEVYLPESSKTIKPGNKNPYYYHLLVIISSFQPTLVALQEDRNISAMASSSSLH
jgi:hypothetical protein